MRAPTPIALFLAACGLIACQAPAPGSGQAGSEQDAAPAAGKAAGGAGGATGAAAPAAKATPAPKPVVVIPSGTELSLALASAVSTATAHTGDAVLARLTEDVKDGERVLAPSGSELRGHVTAAVRSGKVKGRARLALTFDKLVVNGTEHPIEASEIDITAGTSRKKDAAMIGAGAIIGAIAGGKKGAAVGAGAGTGVVLATRGKEVELAAGQALTLKLTADAKL